MRFSFALPVALLAATALAAAPASAAPLGVASRTLTSFTKVYGEPVTCTLSPVADTFVRRDRATASNGTLTTLEVSGSATATRRVLVRFDLAGCGASIPAGAVVREAALRLTLSSSVQNTRTYNLDAVTASWTESTTWNGQPSVDASVRASSAIAGGSTAGTAVSWSTTSDVQAFLSGNATDLGWRIADAAEGSGTGSSQVVQFGSREASAGRPVLVVTYVA